MKLEDILIHLYGFYTTDESGVLKYLAEHGVEIDTDTINESLAKEVKEIDELYALEQLDTHTGYEVFTSLKLGGDL